MEKLYFVKRKRGNYKTLRLEFGEINNKFLPEVKSESFLVETFYDDEKEMLKKVLKMRERLTEEKWMLKTRVQNRSMSMEQ